MFRKPLRPSKRGLATPWMEPGNTSFGSVPLLELISQLLSRMYLMPVAAPENIDDDATPRREAWPRFANAAEKAGVPLMVTVPLIDQKTTLSLPM